MTDFAVEVDGRPLRHLKVNRVSPTDSGLFDLQLPTDNVFGFLEKDVPDLLLSPSAQSGVYVLLKPLRPGTHTLHWTATSSCTEQDITYRITVSRHRAR